MLEFIILAHNMIKGTYIIYEDGKEISRSSNVVTKFGKRFLTNVLAGNASNVGKSIAIGIDNAAATIDDTRLGFEFYRAPVNLSSIDISTVNSSTTYSVVYKSTIPQDVAGTIKEIGLYPLARTSLNNYDSKFISDFNNALDWTNSLGYNPTESNSNVLIGNSLMIMGSNNTSSEEYVSYINLDMSGYSFKDTLTVSYYKFDTHLQSLTIKLYYTDTNYYTATITPSSGTGSKLSSDILIGDILGASTGSTDNTFITKIGIVINPTSGNSTSVGMDGIRVNDEDTFDPIYGLISRSIPDAIIKKSGRQMDIEYKLDLSF